MAINHQLAQIQVPPLTQTLQGDLACPAGYEARHIRKAAQSFSTPEQARGIEIHRVIATYVRHLVKTRQRTDYDFLRPLIAQSSPAAAEVLNPFLESYEFDPESVVGVEIRLAVDADWNPVDPESGEVEFSGGLDLLSLLSPREAAIDDWKSYYQIIDAETFQSEQYTLLAFLHNPNLERVTFNLRFPRFGAAMRSVTKTRADVPELKETLRRERGRQLALHAASAAGDSLPASPGRQCIGCPLLGKFCPVAETNPHTQMPLTERVAFAIWLKEAAAENNKRLREAEIEGGPVTYMDANGNVYEAGSRAVVKHYYPLEATLPILVEWCKDPKEILMQRLNVSGLSSFLKAKKRAPLVEQLSAVVEERTESQFKVRRLKEVETDEEEENQ